MRTTARPSWIAQIQSPATTFIVLGALSLLVACQGLSIGGNGTQQTSGVISLGSIPLNFGNVSAGSSRTMTLTATNTGESSVTVSSVAISTKYFSFNGPTLPFIVSAGQSAAISITFSPDTVGSFNANLAVTSDASNSVTNLSLSGAGTAVALGQLALSTTTEAFGGITIGSTDPQTVTLTNTGAANVDISQVSVSGTGFQISGVTTPLTLAANQSTAFTVSFAPQSTGNASGTVTILSDGANPTLTMALSGIGLSPGALGSNPTSLSFGNVTVGSNQSLSQTLTNTGGSSVTISQVASSGSGFTVSGITAPLTLAAGQSASLSVTFAPTSAGSATGNVTITSNAPNPTLTIALSGTGVSPGTLGFNPASLSFGSVIVGNSQALSETVTNTGGTSVTISQVSISGNGFTLGNITTPLTLNAGQSTTFNVTFAPTSAATSSGTVTIASNGSNSTLSVPLTGTGVANGSLAANPSSLVFGNVTVGSSQSLSDTVTNSGGTSVTISQVSVGGTGFTLSGITAPITLAPSQSTTFTVKFAPTSAGSVTGNVVITSNAANPSLTIPLTGTGVTPGTLGANPASLGFGNVTVNSNQSLSETVTNTGSASVTISQVSLSGTGFTLSGIIAPITLAAGQSTSFTVTFAPTSAGSASGSVTITSNASNPTLSIGLSGIGVTPGALVANPTSLNFGNVTVGSNQSLSETVTNTGGTSVMISNVSISGTGFTLSGITAPLTLAASQSTTFTVTFAPASAGNTSGNITITSNASNATLSITMSGSGANVTGQLTVSPTSLSLGSVVVGTSGTASGTLSATGASVTVTGASTNNSVFTVGGLSLPVTIAAGQSTSFTVTFSPLVATTVNATLTFTATNAQSSTITEALSGTGTSAPVHSVNLSWDASTSPDISGYNIYRAVYSPAPVNTCGTFSKINSLLNTSTLFTDSNVTDGTAYCYATTAVNTSNEESSYSNIVSNVQIPAP